MRITDSPQRPAGPGGTQLPDHLPRLLPAGLSDGPTGLAGHLARYGPPPSSGLDRRRRKGLLEEVGRSGLTGRGGAGFPTARKLAAVAAGHAPVVVANGTEGEPASAKDKVLLARSPHLVLDGAVLAAEIVGARRGSGRRSSLGPRNRGRRSRRAPASRIRPGPDPDHDGRRPVRRRGSQRPRPLDRAWRPHSHQEAAEDLRTGTRWKADTRAERRDPGTPRAHRPLWRIVVPRGRHAAGTRVDAGHHPRGSEPACVHEIAIGTPIQEVLSLAGGASAPLQALLLGGYFGSWVGAAAAATLPFSSAGLAALGAGPGAGLIAVLPADACGLVETATGRAVPRGRVGGPVRPVPVRPGRDRRRNAAGRRRPHVRSEHPAALARPGRRTRRLSPS